MRSLLILALILFSLVLIECGKHKSKIHHKIKGKLRSFNRGQNKTASTNKTTSTIKEGWLAIASNQFIDQDRYPTLPLKNDDKSQIRIKDDRMEGRILEKDDEFTNKTDILKQMKEREPMIEFRVNTEFGLNPKVPNNTFFYFRLTRQNLFYSEAIDNLQQLGAISIINIRSVLDRSDFCIQINDDEIDNWIICSESPTDILDWKNQINTLLGMPPGNASPIQVVEEELDQPVMIYPIATPICNDNWNYNTHGDEWQCNCKDGNKQSPIPLPDLRSTQNIENYMKLNYKPTTIDLKGNPISIKLEENMLRIQGNFGTLDYTEIEERNIGGVQLTKTVPVTYQSYEIQIHTPSDHTLKGKQYPMEVQILHYATTKGNLKKKAVLAFLFDQKAGHPNKFFDDIDTLDLPSVYNLKKELKEAVNIYDLFYDRELLGKSIDYRPFSYYMYDGSLTAPPCDEDTVMIVKAAPILISYTTLELLRDVFNPQSLSASGIGCIKNMAVADQNVYDNENGSFRKIQDLNKRTIYYYDGEACEPQIERDPREGHYERVARKLNQYVFVPGKEPSGMENAYVVSENEAKGVQDDKTKQRALERARKEGFQLG